jgi:hypothetical protein
MRTWNMIIGITAIAASLGLMALFFFNMWYALIAVVLFGVCHQIYRIRHRRQIAKERMAAAPWRKKV